MVLPAEWAASARASAAVVESMPTRSMPKRASSASSAHLAHCQLARDNLAAVAPPPDRVESNYDHPAQVLLTIHGILGAKYLWGSDNPFMSWCDDRLRILYTYKQEMDVVRELPAAVQRSMLRDAPHAWLFGEEA